MNCRWMLSASVVLGACLGAQDVPPRATNDRAFAASLDSALSRLNATGWFSGTVLVMRDSTTLFSRSYGLADRVRNVPNGPETRFNIGSMNKMMTAVAIMQLAEAGKIKLQDNVGRYLPDYPNAAVREKVTLAQLLTHTSGMGSYWNDRFERNKSRIESVDDYVALFVDEPLLFEPGAHFEYSNSGFIVLGKIVERVSGQTYEAYVRQHVFAPAHLTGTDFSAIRDSVPSRAIGYIPEQDVELGDADVTQPAPRMVANWSTLPNRGGPAGGGYTTAPDLMRFGDALTRGTLVAKSWVDSLWTPRVSMPQMPAPTSYGYGFMVRETALGRRIGHTGGSPGVATAFDLYPESGYRVVVLTNSEGPGFVRALRLITATLPSVGSR